MSDTGLYARRLGDDALILGQRLCEWCSNAPVLEEDLALANTALDYLGRARLLLSYAGSFSGKTEDELAFLRGEREFENLLLVELPNGDFAFSMARQFLLDVFEHGFFAALAASSDEQLAAIAGKAGKEVRYHLRRSAEWLRRLGLGTEESNARTQAALDELWGYTAELFEMDSLEERLVSTGVAVDRRVLQAGWLAEVTRAITQAGLRVPETAWSVRGGREGVHTEYLGHLLSELQYLQRAHPGLSW